MIQANLNKLRSCAGQLGGLTVELGAASDQIASSRGLSADSEKEFFQQLLVLGKEDLPELISLSSRLLSVICTDLERADQSAAVQYQGGGGQS